MSLNLANIIAGLEKAAEFAETLVPEIAALTPYGTLATTVVKAVGAATEVAENLQERINEGKIVAASNDQDQVRALAQRLHDLNDKIAEEIDKT